MNTILSLDTSSPDPPSSANMYQRFHPFLRLPLELRLTIWNYAVVGRLVTFEFLEGNMPGFREVFPFMFSTSPCPSGGSVRRRALGSVFDGRKLLSSSSSSSFPFMTDGKTLKFSARPIKLQLGLELACWESYGVANNPNRTEHFVSYIHVRPDGTRGTTRHICFSIPFDPMLDTIHFPHFYELLKFTTNWAISPGVEVESGHELSAVRSVAVSGLPKYIYIRHLRPDIVTGVLLALEAMYFNGPQSSHNYLGGGEFSDMKILKELVYLYPELTEGSAVTTPIPVLASSIEDLLKDTVEDTTRELVRWRTKIENSMKTLQISTSLPHPLSLHPRTLLGEMGNYPSWWEDPKVTLMTETEFMARFE